MYRHLLALLSMALFTAAIACSDWGGADYNPDPLNSENNVIGVKQYNLKPLAGCGDLLKTLQDRAIKQMEERIDKMKGQSYGYYCYDDMMYGPTAGGMQPSSVQNAAPKSAETGANTYSKTNNQVAGVEEADFIKTDGKYIYILANKKLQIIEAFPPMEATVVSTTPIAGVPKRLFIREDKIVVYSSLSGNGRSSVAPGMPGNFEPNYQECTYGYNCDFVGDGTPLQITVLDVEDRSKPEVLREVTFSGSYLNSRRVGKAVYTVVTFHKRDVLSTLKYYLDDYDNCGGTNLNEDELKAKYDALKEENRKKILETTLADWLPSLKDKRFVDGNEVVKEGLLSKCENFYSNGDNGSGDNILSLVSFNIENDGALHVTSVVGDPGAVYASKDALYVASKYLFSGGYWFYDNAEEYKEVTTVHKFKLNNSPIMTQYLASGIVKGSVLNQFSMDEWNGDLRIATTTGRVPSPDVHSTVSVLRQEKNNLQVIGSVDNIAPKEDIRSVRFDGKRGYIVTFKKTDPLFVLDFETPKAPRVLGELKIPGFSTYMHMLDDKHLLTIGYDAEDKGNFAYFQGILLQIFDVSDPRNPSLKHKHLIGTRGSTSDAATNHLAFNYFPEKKLLAIPINVCEDSNGNGSYGSELTFRGLMVFNVDLTSGFSLRGKVAHPLPEQNSYSTCSNWWTDSNSTVKRSIFMDDFVYSVAMDRIKVQNLDSMGSDLREVMLISE